MAMSLRLHAERLGDVREVIGFLRALERTYNNLHAFSLAVEDVKRRHYGDLDDGHLFGRRPQKRQRRFSPTRDVNAIVLPDDRLQLRRVNISSPGFWEFLGLPSLLETLRNYLHDRHERKKDIDYKNKEEAEEFHLENQKRKMDLFKDAIETLRDIGVAEDKIRAALTRNILEPLAELDAVQDDGRISDADIIEDNVKAENPQPGPE